MQRTDPTNIGQGQEVTWGGKRQSMVEESLEDTMAEFRGEMLSSNIARTSERNPDSLRNWTLSIATRASRTGCNITWSIYTDPNNKTL